MRTVNVNASENYNVYIEQGIIDNCGEIVGGLVKGRRCVIISDSNVAPLYAQRVADSLKAAGFRAALFEIEAGESSKNPDNLVKAAELCVEYGLTRSDVLVALGGGVVTDLGGLCGALYQRGIAVVQIPTSLLAMVDSSVGGKTAVNLTSGKNMFGVFYQPRAVLCDSTLLRTLKEEEFANGMAEVIKYAALKGGRILEIIKGNMENNLDELIEECVKIKRDYVCEDERDKGVRQFLNLGHTFGHAVERVSDFSVAHGSAVSIGMCIMAETCEKMTLCSKEDKDLLLSLCKKYNLPTYCLYSADDIYKAALSDKKRESDNINIVIFKGFGDCEIKKILLDDLDIYLKKVWV
ncbi:MAG: 3-dehydroquinate synthase [Ruminococcus sp.]|nr:3-dehydroquinate synthase [Ruminococcus sp.]